MKSIRYSTTNSNRTHRSSLRLKPHRRGGQALVEMAMCVLILVPMLIGILEFGWLMKNINQLGNAAREGARAAAVANTTRSIKIRVGSMATPLILVNSLGVVEKGAITMTVSPAANNGASYPDTLGDTMDTTVTPNVALKNNAKGSDLIKVTATALHPSLTRFFPFLRDRTIAGVGVMRREF